MKSILNKKALQIFAIMLLALGMGEITEAFGNAHAKRAMKTAKLRSGPSSRISGKQPNSVSVTRAKQMAEEKAQADKIKTLESRRELQSKIVAIFEKAGADTEKFKESAEKGFFSPDDGLFSAKEVITEEDVRDALYSGQLDADDINTLIVYVEDRKIVPDHFLNLTDLEYAIDPGTEDKVGARYTDPDFKERITDYLNDTQSVTGKTKTYTDAEKAKLITTLKAAGLMYKWQWKDLKFWN